MSQLSRLGVTGDLSELVSAGEQQPEDDADDEISKSPTAQDFTDITEA